MKNNIMKLPIRIVYWDDNQQKAKTFKCSEVELEQIHQANLEFKKRQLGKY